MRWKWILSIIVVVIIAFFVTVYAIVSTYDFNKLKPMMIQNAKSFTGRDLRVGGDIEIGISLLPTLVTGDVGFQNAPWGSRPEMAKIKRLEVQVALFPLISGDIEVKRLILVEPDILIETDSSGKSNLDFGPPEEKALQKPKGKPEAEAQLPIMTVGQVIIEKGQLTYKEGKSRKVYSVALENVKGASEGLDSPLEFEVEGNYNNTPFEVSGSLGPFYAIVDPNKVLALGLNVKVAGANVVAEGRIKDVMTPKGIDLMVNIQGRSIPELAKVAEVDDLPEMGPFKIDLKVSDPAPKTYKVSDLKIALQESDLGGSAEIGLAGERPKLNASLSSQKLDLRPLLLKKEEKGKAAKMSGGQQSKQEKVFPKDPLPFELLKTADANVNLRAGQVLLRALALNDLTLGMVIKNGRLSLMPLKSAVGGGILDGQFDLRPQGKSVLLAVALKAQQIDLGLMLKDLGIKDMIEGKLDVDIDLKGRGGSVAALMAGLNGKTRMVMGKGRINNKYMDLLGADLARSTLKLINPFSENATYTEANCFVSRFNIKDGLADSTALVLDTSRMSVIGEGDINLKTEKLNLALKPLPKEGIGISGVAKISVSLSEFTKPFKLGGTLAHPSLVLDPTESALTLGKMAGGLLLGPFGIAAALVNVSTDDENPCLVAIEAGEKGVKVTEDKISGEEKGTVEKTTKDETGGVEGVIEGVGKSFKKLFGK
jgi:uncharacterized protein involved in outer membrane biogenesis